MVLAAAAPTASNTPQQGRACWPVCPFAGAICCARRQGTAQQYRCCTCMYVWEEGKSPWDTLNTASSSPASGRLAPGRRPVPPTMDSIQGISSDPLPSTTVFASSRPGNGPLAYGVTNGHEQARQTDWRQTLAPLPVVGPICPPPRLQPDNFRLSVSLPSPSNGPCAPMPHPASRPPANLEDGGAFIATHTCQHNTMLGIS